MGENHAKGESVYRREFVDKYTIHSYKDNFEKSQNSIPYQASITL